MARVANADCLTSRGAGVRTPSAGFLLHLQPRKGSSMGGLLISLVCQSIIGSLVGAVILRAACSWYNSMVGRSRAPRDYSGQPAMPGQFPAAGDNPYSSPAAYSPPQVNMSVGVPEPDFGKAWLISFVTILVNG